jgi:hypothetical protein
LVVRLDGPAETGKLLGPQAEELIECLLGPPESEMTSANVLRLMFTREKIKNRTCVMKPTPEFDPTRLAEREITEAYDDRVDQALRQPNKSWWPIYPDTPQTRDFR